MIESAKCEAARSDLGVPPAGFDPASSGEPRQSKQAHGFRSAWRHSPSGRATEEGGLGRDM